jgi:hypothetical protein
VLFDDGVGDLLAIGAVVAALDFLLEYLDTVGADFGDIVEMGGEGLGLRVSAGNLDGVFASGGRDAGVLGVGSGLDAVFASVLDAVRLGVGWKLNSLVDLHRGSCFVRAAARAAYQECSAFSLPIGQI